MPRKVRELRADLRQAGYRFLKRRGKGSHGRWVHPLVDAPVTLSGHDGDDAHAYQERDVRDAVRRARDAEGKHK